MTSTQWVEYHNGTKRKSYNTLPTSDITAEAVSVGGFTLSQTDNAGVTSTAGRSYTANGMIHSRTDGRGNTSTTVTDIAGRTLTVTDAAGNVTTTAYDPAHDLPATVTDAQGNTSCYRYDVRGYLQITCCDLTLGNNPALWLITWEPTQPIATRPLAIQKDGTWYSAPARLALQDSRSQVYSRLGVWLLKSHPAYGWDLTKNICELYGSNGYIRTAYTYTPYGEVTESANSVYQPIQWSSEYNDDEFGLVYYNYRHYNPMDGRWLGRDIIGIKGGLNLFCYVTNKPIQGFDIKGASWVQSACCAVAAGLILWDLYDTITSNICLGKKGKDWYLCMIENVILTSNIENMLCCIYKNIKNNDTPAAIECITSEYIAKLREIAKYTAIACCLGPHASTLIQSIRILNIFYRLRLRAASICSK